MTISTKAGRYELLQELGRGSMGVVYRAHDPMIGRTVAVKTVQITAEVAGMAHGELLKRFQTEARAAGLLAHPNIVVVYDAGEDEGVFYITMELVEGRSLQEQMNQRQSFPLPRVLRWMQQACSALEFAHQHSVVHRDIKPANLMLMADDTLKVTDFGTAKILQLNTTQTAHVIGTPSYMSPEQIKGKPVDGRTDVFSLGVVLYELLTGAKPFPGESVTSVIYKVVNEDPVPPRELDTTIHPGLSAIVQRALSKSPWARFQSCREFAEALEHYQDFDEPRAARGAPAVAPKLQHAPTSLSPVVSLAGSPMASPAKPVLGQTPWATLEEPPKRHGGFALITLLLLAIIGATGYRVYPALQEIWQLRNARAGNAVASSSALSSVATPDAAPIDGNPADKQSAGATTVSAAPAVSSPSAPLNSAPSASTGSQEEANSVNAPARALVNTSADALANAPVDAPTNVANAAVPPVAPTAVPGAAQAPVAAKPPVRRKAAAPQASQVAMNWKDLIDAKLESSNIQGDVRVAAVGNSVILTGRLNPFAHARLLRQLQFVPQGLQIVDDIEYSEAQATRGSQEDDPSAKR